MNQKTLKKLQEKLINTNRRNRAIRLSRIIKKRCFDMSDLGKIHEGRDIKILGNLFFNGKSENLISLNAKSEAEEKTLENLRYLYRELDSIFKERGTYECFLSYPFVQGNFSDGEFFRAPLFLLPVKITLNRKTGKMRLETMGDSGIEANKTFFMALNKYNKGRNSLDLEKLKETENLSGDELILWAKKLFESWGFEVISQETEEKNDTYVRKASGFTAIQEQSSETEEKIIKLNDLKTDEYPEYPISQIEFKPFFILGQFSQTSEAIYNDYEPIMESEDKLIEKILGEENEREMGNRRDEDNFIDDSPEEDNFFINEPDISQEKAIVNSRKENGTVIHGPPGTGKSQVITNLIADNLPRGKKILLVCEKRAALDVVKNRLKNIKKNCILVHDCNKERDATFRDMASVLDDYKSNAGDPERRKHKENIIKKSKEIDEKITEIRELINLFNDSKDRGITLRDIYKRTEKEFPHRFNNPTLENDDINFEKLEKLSTRISALSEDFYKFENEDFYLFNRKRFGNDFDEESFKETIRRCVKDFHDLETILHDEKSKNQIKLISTDEKNFEFLRNIYGELKQFEELKNRKLKIRIFKWMKLKLKYSELLKNGDLNQLLSEWREINEALGAAEKRINDLKRHFKEEEIKKIESNVASFNSNADFFRKIEKETFHILEDIMVFDGKLENLSDFETRIAQECLEKLKEGKDKTIWEDTIKKNFYLKWINEAESKHPKIREFSGEYYEEKISELKKLMKEKIELIPSMIEEFLSRNYSEGKHKEQDLIHEVNKKRRKMTIRELIERFWDAGISSIFPCWMCSPETVSAIFPMKKDMFDLVIFDEASQIKLEKSLPTLFRAKKCIVAGDENQLPPTNFFESGNEEAEDEDYEYEEKQTIEIKSLLEQAKRMFSGSHHLRYHYRSEFEELINFSNYAIYGGRLKIPPKNRTDRKIPIEYINVKGVWESESKTNEKEAKEVVKRIKEILSEREDDSTIGIITFNQSQKELIKNFLDEEAKEDPEFGTLLDKEYGREEEGEDKSLFVKNIENVQGDERDIIIFSTGYGYNKLNKFKFGFGPISQFYGKNRLNVAISRSRKKIIIYSSMEASDFDKYKGTSEGTKLLCDYLKYCKYVSSDKKGEARDLLNSYVMESKMNEATIPEHEEFDSEFEAEVKDELNSRGYEVKTQVGSMGYKIDLGVVHPEDKTKYLAGIECDRARYYSSRSAKERDLHRQKILEDGGWVIFKVWSRDWWKNRKEVIEKLDRKLKSKL